MKHSLVMAWAPFNDPWYVLYKLLCPSIVLPCIYFPVFILKAHLVHLTAGIEVVSPVSEYPTTQMKLRLCLNTLTPKRTAMYIAFPFGSQNLGNRWNRVGSLPSRGQLNSSTASSTTTLPRMLLLFPIFLASAFLTLVCVARLVSSHQSGDPLIPSLQAAPRPRFGCGLQFPL